MTKDRLYLFDTTLRDGQQTQGVDFSAEDKRRIAAALDELGIDYIEGGWPGANPVDTEFFANPPKPKRAKFLAFGMTKRAGRSAENDDVLAGVLNAGTDTVCLVGKTHVFHVKTALGITNDENLENIRASIAHCVAQNRETMLDAEHFFDGYKADPDYALSCIEVALAAGARWVVLCDTNGGTLPGEVATITRAVCERFGGDKIGIHTHDDTGNAVANTLAAVEAGARQVQGTLNGLGERCGNANLVSIIPTLLLKSPFAEMLETGVSADGLARLPRLSHLLDEILNRPPNPHAPYVGTAAFAHKAGLHASAIIKDPTTYEHVPPEAVGNERVIPMSNQAGRSNLLKRLAEAGISVKPDDPRLARLLEHVKEMEEKGFAYDSAEASFVLLARRFLDQMPTFFEVDRYRVTVERRHNVKGDLVTASEAVVKVAADGEKFLSVSESLDPMGGDQGPINALSRALRKDLGKYQSYIEDLELEDFKVRIVGRGTAAVTRVLIISRDRDGNRWATVGVSANIVDASFQALEDAVIYKLLTESAPTSAKRAIG